MNKLTELKQEEQKSIEISERFKEIIDSVLQDDEEMDYPEYDDVTSSF